MITVETLPEQEFFRILRMVIEAEPRRVTSTYLTMKICLQAFDGEVTKESVRHKAIYTDPADAALLYQLKVHAFIAQIYFRCVAYINSD